MKRFISLMLCAIILFSCCVFQASATNEEEFLPHIVYFSLTSSGYETVDDSAESRATGLITSYKLSLSTTGTTLNIRAETYCIPDVVKSGFKDLVVQRRVAGSTSWSDYYDYGDLYNDTYGAGLTTYLVVPSGYQYRLSCKHYAKKSLLVTQSISNTSNVVGV